MDVVSVGNICSNPHKLYQPCKLWIQNQCPRLPISCVYIHSYFCPDKESCKREFCTLLHHNLENTQSDSSKKNGGHEASPQSCNAKEAKKKGFTKSRPPELIIIDDNDKIRISSPSPTFDDELCQELEEIGEELDRFTEETVGNSDFTRSKEFQILCNRDGVESNKNADLKRKPAERRKSPSKFDFFSCLASKEENAFNPQKWLDDFCFKPSEKPVDRESYNIETVSRIRSEVGQSEKEIEDDSAKAKLLLKQKSQLMKNAKFLIDQKKLLTTERDNVIKRVKGGSVNQSKISRVLDENARLTKELSAHLQSITTNIQKINEKIGHIAKKNERKVESVPVNLSREKEVLLSNHGSEAKQNLKTKEIFDKITNSLQGQEFSPNRKQASGKTEEAKVKSPDSEHRIWENTPQHTDQNHNVSPQGTCSSNGDQVQGETAKEKQDVINEETSSTLQSYGSEGEENVSNEGNTTSSNKFSNDERKIVSCGSSHTTETEISQNSVLAKDKFAPKAKGIEVKANRSSKDKNTYWCKKCNAFYTSVYGYVEHLESTSHFENVKNGSQTLGRITGNGCKENDGVSDALPQGVEFLHSTTVFFCELCSQVMYDKDEAILHPQKSQHLMKYKEHIQVNVTQEIQFMKEKMSALTEYCKKRQVKVVKNASVVITDCPTESSKSCTGSPDKETNNLDSSSSTKRKLTNEQSEHNKKNRAGR
ncbi:zinc finger protein 318-like isoform X2 [Penaeus chinensis]|nr:zinc finger protein 318-like isoform X2 [Penaeus chinensis]XP_047493082.1 zinc finger protein 318-like isoform X2 [Penaeus chinensis]XP_047493083.1 zinc finger protein 318-like isoform X2 [Penaeus chinensis]